VKNLDKRPIPVTPLLALYRTLRRASQRERLLLARELAAHPDEVAARVRESVERFRVYDNRAEPFVPTHAALAAPLEIVGGRSLAAALAQSPLAVKGGEVSFTFTLVDYEVPPARTTIKAPRMLNRYEDGSPSTTAMVVDLLLRHEDGTPVIGEAKVAKFNGYDTDAVLALVQSLAGAAQFATPNQLARLHAHYSDWSTAPQAVDVAVVAYHPTRLAAARYQLSLTPPRASSRCD
jgi:hypothetical protein